MLLIIFNSSQWRTGVKKAAIIIFLFMVIFLFIAIKNRTNESIDSAKLISPSTNSINRQLTAESDGSTTNESKTAAQQRIAPSLTFDNYQSKFGKLPQSLRDTSIPFNLTIDAKGNLLPDLNLRILFDYFLTTVGEESNERVIERLKELLVNNLPSSASTEALEILQSYIDLTKAIIELQQGIAHQTEAPHGLAGNYAEMHRLQQQLRKEFLSDSIYEAFYADEDKRAEYSLQTIKIRQRTDINEQEKQRLMDELLDNLPAEARERKINERDRDLLAQRVEAAQRNGATGGEIFQMRSDVIGAEAAERFAKADAQAALWDNRVKDYRAQRQEILDLSYLSVEAKQAQITELQKQAFDEREQLRINVIDRMEDKKSKDSSNSK